MPTKTSTHERLAEHSSRVTTDHDEIRRWAEARKAKPACVRSTEEQDSCLLRLDLPGYSGGDSLEAISWERFFDIFETNSLAFVYQEQTVNGEPSNFNKLVRRDSHEK